MHCIKVSTGIMSDGEENEDDLECRQRRDMLARRPSYRKILNELSEAPTITVTKIEEESNSSHDGHDDSCETATNLSANTVVIPTHSIQLSGADGGAGLQTLTMTNAGLSNANAQTGTTIVQYAQSADGQFFIPAGNMQAYQIATPTSLPQGVVMSSGLGSPQQQTEEAQRKRELRLLKNSLNPGRHELRLLKNRDAARECRRKKKEYVKCLENRVAVLENQNKALIEELKSLKELYCQKDA